MSHAEIWDDSALVESWNEAVEEYKRYHSIHVRGENVEEALQSHDNPSKSPAVADGNQYPAQEGFAGNPKAECSMKVDDSLREDEANNLDKNPVEAERRIKLSATYQPSKLKPSESLSNEGPIVPQHLVGSVPDEGLKSLLMSWYYAGYYTGLYEGQHKTS